MVCCDGIEAKTSTLSEVCGCCIGCLAVVEHRLPVSGQAEVLFFGHDGGPCVPGMVTGGDQEGF